MRKQASLGIVIGLMMLFLGVAEQQFSVLGIRAMRGGSTREVPARRAKIVEEKEGIKERQLVRYRLEEGETFETVAKMFYLEAFEVVNLNPGPETVPEPGTIIRIPVVGAEPGD